MLSAWLQYLLLHLLVLEAQRATAETVKKSAPKKRGGGWGYTAQNVSNELQAMPVQWWYNWGNGIPDPAAEATTAVKITIISQLDHNVELESHSRAGMAQN